MEVDQRKSERKSILSFFLKAKVPFAPRAEVDWARVRACGGAAVGIGVLVLLFLPPAEETRLAVDEDARDVPAELRSPLAHEAADPTGRTLELMSVRGEPMMPGRFRNEGRGPGSKETEQSMVLVRPGSDSGVSVPAGTRLRVRLIERATVGVQAMPVIGEVTADLMWDGSPVIRKGARILGEISFDEGTERAKVDWKAIRLPEGRERPLAGIGIGEDGQVGVEGDIRSQVLRNVGGQMLTRFVAAYAEGSMRRGPLGSSEGGSENGLKYAVAETAKDRANAWAEDLSKEAKWIEVAPDRPFAVVLTQAFVFRDPGFTHGR